MQSVLFNLRPTVSPERQETILAEVAAWGEVANTGRIQPDAHQAALRRMCYTYVVNDQDVAGVLGRLSQLPEVESAFVPAARRVV